MHKPPSWAQSKDPRMCAVDGTPNPYLAPRPPQLPRSQQTPSDVSSQDVDLNPLRQASASSPQAAPTSASRNRGHAAVPSPDPPMIDPTADDTQAAPSNRFPQASPNGSRASSAQSGASPVIDLTGEDNAAPAQPVKKKGRPIGSKNKPKVRPEDVGGENVAAPEPAKKPRGGKKKAAPKDTPTVNGEAHAEEEAGPSQPAKRKRGPNKKKTASKEPVVIYVQDSAEEEATLPRPTKRARLDETTTGPQPSAKGKQKAEIIHIPDDNDNALGESSKPETAKSRGKKRAREPDTDNCVERTATTPKRPRPSESTFDALFAKPTGQLKSFEATPKAVRTKDVVEEVPEDNTDYLFEDNEEPSQLVNPTPKRSHKTECSDYDLFGTPPPEMPPTSPAPRSSAASPSPKPRRVMKSSTPLLAELSTIVEKETPITPKTMTEQSGQSSGRTSKAKARRPVKAATPVPQPNIVAEKEQTPIARVSTPHQSGRSSGRTPQGRRRVTASPAPVQPSTIAKEQTPIAPKSVPEKKGRSSGRTTKARSTTKASSAKSRQPSIVAEQQALTPPVTSSASSSGRRTAQSSQVSSQSTAATSSQSSALSSQNKPPTLESTAPKRRGSSSRQLNIPMISAEEAMEMNPRFPWRARGVGEWDVEGRWFSDGFKPDFERDWDVSEED